MKKIICSIIAVLAFLVIVGPATAGPIDWVINKLGIVKDDELDTVRKDLSEARHQLTETKNDVNKLTTRVEEVESATWTLWGLLLLTFYACCGLAIGYILYRIWVKAYDWYHRYKSRKESNIEDII